MRAAASQSAATLLLASRQHPRLRSGSSSMDALLTPESSEGKEEEFGLAPVSVLELTGPPGSGKSKTALGYAIEKRFKALNDGSTGDVLIIDAEGSLSPSLIHSTAQAYGAFYGCDPDLAVKVSQGIQYRRICDVSVLVAFFHTFSHWLSNHPHIRLVILDSLSSHLRPTSLDRTTQNMIRSLISSTLANVTSLYSVAIIVTTKMSLKMFSSDGAPSSFQQDAEALLVPQLGTSWIGGPCWRIVLYFDEIGQRHAHLIDSPVSSRSEDANFVIDDIGACDQPRQSPSLNLSEDAFI